MYNITNTPTQVLAKQIAKYMVHAWHLKKKTSECASFIWSVYKSSIRQAAEEHDFSYSFLQRRISGEEIQFNMNGPLTILLRQKKEP